MKRQRVFVIIGVLGAVAAAAALSVSRRGPAPTTVQVATVARADLQAKVTANTSIGAVENFQQITRGVEAAGLVVAGIALLVGGVGVMNIMLVNVTQRTREIGIRKALGATRRDIATQFLIEAVTLTAVGGAFGIAIGLGAGVAAGPVLDFEAATPLWSVLLGFLVSTTVGLVFGMWPAVRAARQDPIEALRYE